MTTLVLSIQNIFTKEFLLNEADEILLLLELYRQIALPWFRTRHAPQTQTS